MSTSSRLGRIACLLILLSVAAPAIAGAQVQSDNFLNTIVNEYKAKAAQWQPVILEAATRLFWILAGIELAWTALMLGLWIPNFYYWGLNQYITQRTLASSSLAEGQKGIVFSAFMKILIPFVVVIPGIIAFNLFAKDMQNQSVGDNAAVIAKYAQANSETDLVDVVQAPSEESIAV